MLISIGTFSLYGAKLGALLNEVIQEREIPSGYIPIRSVADLLHIAVDMQRGIRDGKYIVLNNINLKGIPWRPLGIENLYEASITNDTIMNHAFQGEFNGNGYSIIGIEIDDVPVIYTTVMQQAYQGLFLAIGSDAFIHDINITYASLHAQRGYNGILAARNAGFIKNIQVHGTITIQGNNSSVLGFTGSIVGENMETGRIVQGYASVDINAFWYVGGIVGKNNGSISQSIFRGSIKATNSIGGIAGYIDTGVIQQSYSIANIVGNNEVGGLVGRMAGGTVQNTMSQGSVAGKQYVGGLIGLIISDEPLSSVAAEMESSQMISDDMRAQDSHTAPQKTHTDSKQLPMKIYANYSSVRTRCLIRSCYQGGLIGLSVSNTMVHIPVDKITEFLYNYLAQTAYKDVNSQLPRIMARSQALPEGFDTQYWIYSSRTFPFPRLK